MPLENSTADFRVCPYDISISLFLKREVACKAFMAIKVGLLARQLLKNV